MGAHGAGDTAIGTSHHGGDMAGDMEGWLRDAVERRRDAEKGCRGAAGWEGGSSGCGDAVGGCSGMQQGAVGPWRDAAAGLSRAPCRA